MKTSCYFTTKDTGEIIRFDPNAVNGVNPNMLRDFHLLQEQIGRYLDMMNCKAMTFCKE